MAGECLMYGLDLESRCLAPLKSEEEKVQFLIGSQNIKLDNQVCLLTVEGEWARISARSFSHTIGEVRGIDSSHSQHGVIVTASSDYRLASPKHRINIFRLIEDKSQLEELKFKDSETAVERLSWDAQTNNIAFLSGNRLNILDGESLNGVFSRNIDGQLHNFSFSPHNGGNVFGVCSEKDVISIDTRAEEGSELRIREAHTYRALTLDFNPNLQYTVATGGDDGAIRIWDWRKPTHPVYAVRPHAHWVWQVSYHPVHDQLLLSCGADAGVILSCMQSVSSEANALLETDTEDDVTPLCDGVLDRIDEHEESVYGCVWSSADPWTYASLSHDGRVVMGRVGRQHKYALMQL